MAKLKKFEIEWADDSLTDQNDELFEDKSPSSEEGSFSDILSKEGEPPSHNLQVGEKVRGIIMKISDANDIFVDIGSKIPASIAKMDLIDENSGKLSHKEGDILEAFIVSKNSDTILLSNSLSHKIARAGALEDAYHSKIPVQAKVVAINKGGYELETMGHKAFCPLSQMESFFVKDPEVYLGKQLDFIVSSYNKKQCLLSRRNLQQEKAKKKIQDLFDRLDEKPEVTGTITGLKDFGAHVLIDACLEAFLHISELSFSHVDNIHDFLEIGQNITVSVIDITGDFSSERLPRVSLSLKAREDDPWENASKEFLIGGNYKAKVVRLLPFGAFVSLKPGVEGLIHVSEMSWIKSVRKPEELLSIGDIVAVRVLELDSFKKKMSLTLKAIEDDPWLKASNELTPGTKKTVEIERLKSFGAICVLLEGVTGLVPKAELQKKFGQGYRKKSSPPHSLDIIIKEVNTDEKKVLLGLDGMDEEDSSLADYKEYLASSSPASGQKQESSFSNNNDDEESTFNFGSLLGEALKKKK